MSIQTIIDRAQKITFDRRRVVGQSVSRSQRVKTAERLTAQPFRLTVTPPAYLDYGTNRSTIEAIQLIDRNTEATIKIANNTKTAYITQYQGGLSGAQLAALTVTNFTLTSVTISGLPSITGTITSSTLVLKSGDWIQPVNSRYPYIVTSDVTRGTGSLVTATVHRNLITSEVTTITNAGLLVGTDTTLKVVITELPTYEIGLHKFVNFSGDFGLVEKII